MLLWPSPCLTARSGGTLLFALPLSKGEQVSLRFTHSLNRSPITDVFEWTGSELILRKTIFDTFGAGVPVPSDGIGTELLRRDGHYELDGIDRPMRQFSLLTQPVPDQHILAGGREISLLALAGAGASVVISVEPVPRLLSLAART